MARNLELDVIAEGGGNRRAALTRWRGMAATTSRAICWVAPCHWNQIEALLGNDLALLG